jgi:1,4-dihydroxy-6-naphthoate synthase
MFDALVNGRIDTGPYRFEVTLADIAELNRIAAEGGADMIKVSYAAFARMMEQYSLLDAGSALGFGVGPLLISKTKLSRQDLIDQNLPVAIPGKSTTANLLLDFYAPKVTNRVEYVFHDIMPAILRGEVAAGVIIHENRFTYTHHGLQLIQDLGAYWEAETGAPIPLGGIVASRSLGPAVIADLERLMRESVAYAFAHRDASSEYVRCHAQEMDPAVMQAHIDLYVNEYSLSLGETGRKGVDTLLAVALGK